MFMQGCGAGGAVTAAAGLVVGTTSKEAPQNPWPG
jgi:hypothetical protein